MSVNPGQPQSLQPLAGLKIIDFSTLLPGPLASLILADAGAEVVKVERPGAGDEMRSYPPLLGNDGANFVLLNRGKTSLALDLKNPADNAAARALILEADIVIEQFRPGVMARLGLSYEELSAINPRLIYCSITGYGQTGPKVDLAAHDLNLVGDAGMLLLATDTDGTPSIPATALADVGGGSYPAVINILLAVIDRDRSGRGAHLDIAMGENVFPFLYWALGKTVAGEAILPNGELVTGASPRYTVYRTRDDRFIVAAPLEEKFWQNFCRILEVPETSDKAEIAHRVAARTADEWMKLFEGVDVCCTVARTMEEALADPAFHARGVFDRTVLVDGKVVPALPLPTVRAYGDFGEPRSAPSLPTKPPAV